MNREMEEFHERKKAKKEANDKKHKKLLAEIMANNPGN